MTKREKFKTVTIILDSPFKRNIALAKMTNAPIDTDKPLEWILREKVKVRGLDANGYYWLRLGEIAEQAWFQSGVDDKPQRYSKDAWHIYAGRMLMPEIVTTKDGERRSKWVTVPDGSVAVISTTLLESAFFAKYTEIVEAFGASLGVMFSANPRERAAA